MRRSILAALVVAGCSSSYGSVEPAPLDVPDRDAGVDASTPGEGGQPPTNDGGPVTPEAGADAGADAGDGVPFSNRLVLRFEADAPNGLQSNGAFRDLSPGAKTVSLVMGTPTVAFAGSSGAKAMIFDTTGPVFDVADGPDLRFGATDDFFVVARVLVTAPLGSDSGCTFRYLFSKYSADGATGPHVRVCAPNTGRDISGALKLGPAETTVAVPASLQSTYGIVSFGRIDSGTRIETYAAGVSQETTLAQPVDVSSSGSAFVVGGARLTGTGSPFGAWIGRVNRFYVYHAPPGTFTKGDLDGIRTYMAGAQPKP